MDIFTKSKRSSIMSKISGKETKPEIAVRKFLFSQGFRYRKNVKKLAGKPDIVLAKYKTVVFVHGCFWHGHSCKAAKLPETRREFWEQKISSNTERDKRNIAELQQSGWHVITVWQCEINNIANRTVRLNELVEELKNVFKKLQ